MHLVSKQSLHPALHKRSAQLRSLTVIRKRLAMKTAKSSCAVALTTATRAQLFPSACS